MALDPQARHVLELVASAALPPLHQRGVELARASFNLGPLAGPPAQLARVETRTVPGPAGDIPVRLYIPEGPGPFPALVYYHGGGWVLGDLETVDVPCRRIAREAGCVVMSVDYRRAPEHRYPAAAEDAFAAAAWLAAHGAGVGVDPRRLAVGGDSAGGNLAAVVALMARDRGSFALCQQVLLYPVTLFDFASDSYRDNADGYLLTRADMQWFWSLYLDDPAQGREPYASPLLAEDLAGLPPALVITAGFDPLRDEGEAYALRLAAAGVAVEQQRYAGMIHGFCWMPGALAAGGQALDQAAAALRRAFGGRRDVPSAKTMNAAQGERE